MDLLSGIRQRRSGWTLALGWLRFGVATAHVVFEKSGDCFGQVTLAGAEF